MHSVFISYPHETSAYIATKICNAIEGEGITCWYEPRDPIIGKYPDIIVEAIDNCKVFVLVVDESSTKSLHVMSELDTAFKNIDERSKRRENSHPLIKETTTIIPFIIGGQPSDRNMRYYLGSFGWVNADYETIDASIAELAKKVSRVLKGDDNSSEIDTGPQERYSSLYYKVNDDFEAARSKEQCLVIDYFLSDKYDDILSKKERANILDVGSGYGHQMMSYVKERENISCAVGIDFNQRFVDYSNKNYGSNKVCFYKVDCESDDFRKSIRAIMSEKKIKQFDFINISFTLLHLLNPLKMMITLQEILSDDGKMMIIDVDDDLTMAYPDPSNCISKFMSLISKSKTSGFRHSGREAYKILKDAGLNKITLERNGFSTIGVPPTIKNYLYRSCIELVPEMMSEMSTLYPDDKKIESYNKLADELKDDVKKQYYDSGFYMTFGFMVYIVSK